MATRKRRQAAPRVHQRVRRGNEQDAEQLRGALLSAAGALFSEGGLNAVTMRAVSAQVGVSAMTPYRYFAGKAELLTGLWESVIRAVCDRMNLAFAAHTGARERQRAVQDAYLSYWESHPDHYRLCYMTEEATDRQEKSSFTRVPVYQELHALVRALTLETAAHIGADETHVKLAGDIQFAMLLGYLHATLVIRRYPWSDHQILRAEYIEQTIAAVERCLLHGPGAAAGRVVTRSAAAA